MKKATTYAAAGVDIEEANATKRRIKSLVRSTFRAEALMDIGGFGGLFAPRWDAYEEPVLVSSVDSVGTKLKIAFLTGNHRTVGIDIVSHCANDILVHGAEPLFFLDYLGMGKHVSDVAVEVVEGVAEGCKRAGCTLIGGEMAELPDFYQEGEYDLAGTIVGIVDRGKILDGSKIRPGDRIIGLGSDGLHTNGYSLARKLVFEMADLAVDVYVARLGRTLGDELLRPHRCYVKPILALMKSGCQDTDRRAEIHGMVHITGGGFWDNIPRVLPSGTAVRIQKGTWPVSPIFPFLQEIGRVEEEEMFHVFNMGIGMMIIVCSEDVRVVLDFLEGWGERAYLIGEIVEGDQGVELFA